MRDEHVVMFRRRASGGFTLIEVVFAVGIFAVVMAAFLQVLMGAHRANTAVAASMTANSAIRAQADEAMAVAAELAATGFDGNSARAFVSHYGSLPESDTLPIGPNGTSVRRIEIDGDFMIYRFAVPQPGAFGRVISSEQLGVPGGDGDIIPGNGVGEMRIYLNESKMPPLDIDGDESSGLPLTNDQGEYVVWETEGDRPGDGADGLLSLTSDLFDGAADVRNPPEELCRVFADITVSYYDDPAHTMVLAINQRRIVVVGALDQDRLWR